MVHGYAQLSDVPDKLRREANLGVHRRLTGLEKPVVPMPQPYYDVRVLADNVKAMTGADLTTDTLRTLVTRAGEHDAS